MTGRHLNEIFLIHLLLQSRNFRFTCAVPKKLEIEPMVLKVLPTKDKVLARNNAEVIYLQNKTEITWHAYNLKAQERYEFRW